ncbi:RdgB/HAM1 family non-canonical purine NTP pyrophosphatase [Corynebacterium lowii]|uniref:dITP/XTP pyrophosphatase n=1 Tax=Corynebacterium lowii TaxID=1544413 RepID=A0A0Q0UAL8_9CORY|nr:RdgB/HAM1 family non-canonical purine NTP pyrophosphatase [Corynebacterium lowii]KQB84828.1 Non-canonical purine NTP pyrophosphatase [Corynebacterium lowii]MDP9851732.1 XTP/dITP diphosphohydrolase [Corynebacterium lowii]
MKLLVASNNQKKLRELRRIIDAAGISGISLLSLADVAAYPEPVESGRTFADNALIKARAGARHTGLVTVADDSGLAVEEMNGMPGVLSARWAGAHGNDVGNNRLLLGQMNDVPDERRAAAFVSVCALVTPSGKEVLSEGRWEGRLLREPVGKNGFGYDPIFAPADGNGRSSAQLTDGEKDALSHRSKALAGLVKEIGELV